jgi:polyphosphate glucokinase
MNVLVIDVGGTHVKVLATGQEQAREFASGPTLTPKRLVVKVRKLVADWEYEVISIGYPGPVLRNRPISEPWNLGKGWMGFKFDAAFKRPVKVINDAAMQALGSYQGGNSQNVRRAHSRPGRRATQRRQIRKGAVTI